MCQDKHLRMHPGYGGMGMNSGHGDMGMYQGDCGCHGGFSRHLQTKQEKIEKLGEYQQQLELELQAVKEHIEFLKGK